MSEVAAFVREAGLERHVASVQESPCFVWVWFAEGVTSEVKGQVSEAVQGRFGHPRTLQTLNAVVVSV